MSSDSSASSHRPGGSEAPYLVLVAFWQETPATEAIAHAVRRELFPTPDGYPRGSVVTFRREVALGSRFRSDLARFDLANLYDGVEGSP